MTSPMDVIRRIGIQEDSTNWKIIEGMLDQARQEEALRYAHWLKLNEKCIQRMNMNRLKPEDLYQLFKSKQ